MARKIKLSDVKAAEKIVAQGALTPAQEAWDALPDAEQAAILAEAPATESPAADLREAAEVPFPETPAPLVITEVTPIDHEAEAQAKAIQAEQDYGIEKLTELLADRDAFLAECAAGLEPSVAEALFAKAAKTGAFRAPNKGTGIPHLPKSTCESPVAKVWEIASSMKDASRKDVVTACVLAGVATSTANTQYQAWFKAGKTSVTGAPIIK